MKTGVRSGAFVASWLGLALALSAAPAAAVTPGMVDTFEAGSDAGWAAGVASPVPPVVVGSGGPGGDGDGYLSLTAIGGFGAGSRLTVIAGPQWAGDYLGSGVQAIRMDVNNLGATELDLRLWLAGALGSTTLSAAPVVVPAGSGWTTVSFSLDPADLTGEPLSALGAVQQLRLFHGTTASFPGDAVIAQLGIDNVSAVPETAAWALWLPGLWLLGRAARKRVRPRLLPRRTYAAH
jgi:hypothetical protein